MLGKVYQSIYYGAFNKQIKEVTYDEHCPRRIIFEFDKQINIQTQRWWFKELLDDKNYLMFTAESDTIEILGFIIYKLIPAPEVCNPGDLTQMIEDFFSEI